MRHGNQSPQQALLAGGIITTIVNRKQGNHVSAGIITTIVNRKHGNQVSAGIVTIVHIMHDIQSKQQAL
jgi:hypothetical protein